MPVFPGVSCGRCCRISGCSGRWCKSFFLYTLGANPCSQVRFIQLRWAADSNKDGPYAPPSLWTKYQSKVKVWRVCLVCGEFRVVSLLYSTLQMNLSLSHSKKNAQEFICNRERSPPQQGLGLVQRGVHTGDRINQAKQIVWKRHKTLFSLPFCDSTLFPFLTHF